MAFKFSSSDFPDFERFLYDKSRKTSDFFEQTCLKIARFARLGYKLGLTSNSEESNLVICCCKSAPSPETRKTSFCILMATGPFPLSLLLLRFLLGVPELEPSSASAEADTSKWRLLATSWLLLAPLAVPVPLVPPPSLASSPSDDQSSLLEILESSTNLK